MPFRAIVECDTGALLAVQCTLICGDNRDELRHYRGQVDLIVTSPPYADARKRHYTGVHPDKYVDWFLTFHEPFFAALKPSGSLVMNIKDRVVNGARHRYVWQTIEALCQRGWLAIDDYIWHKPNPMPGYWPARLSDGWEYCFHLAKQTKPYFCHEAIKKPIGDWAETRLNNLSENDLSRHNSATDSGFGRDLSRWVGKKKVLPSNVITTAVVGKNKNHPAVFPLDIPEFFIKLLSPQGGLVVDPFAGSGTTAIAALSLGRHCVLIDNQPEYYRIALQRLVEEQNMYIVEEPAVDTENSRNGSFKVVNKPLQRRLLDKDAPKVEDSGAQHTC